MKPIRWRAINKVFEKMKILLTVDTYHAHFLCVVVLTELVLLELVNVIFNFERNNFYSFTYIIHDHIK